MLTAYISSRPRTRNRSEGIKNNVGVSSSVQVTFCCYKSFLNLLSLDVANRIEWSYYIVPLLKVRKFKWDIFLIDSTTNIHVEFTRLLPYNHMPVFSGDA